MSTAPEPPPWIQWPVRVVAVVVVLPFRVAWELLKVVGGFLERYVGRPLAWLWRRLVVVPLSRLAHWLVVVPLRWLARWVWTHRAFLVRPLVFLVRYLVVVPVAWFFTVTGPVWEALGRGLAWTVESLYRWILLPGWLGTGWVLRQLYRWLFRPIGLAIAWAWGWTVVPAWRVVAGAGRWVRDTVVRPGAGMARAVLVSVGLRR